MIYKAKVLRLDAVVEEAVLIQIAGREIECFASFCPYRIEEGQIYPVQLELAVFNKYCIVECKENSPDFFPVGQGFSYLVSGTLKGGILKVGTLSFFDEFLRSNYGYLDGKMVTMSVDRIDLEFLLINTAQPNE